MIDPYVITALACIAILATIAALVLWAKLRAIPNPSELDFWKRVTSLARVGHFRWLQNTDTWMDNTARRLTGLAESPSEWPPPDEVVLYQTWADTILDSEELDSAQKKAIDATETGQIYTGLTRQKNGRILLHKGAPNVDGYRLSGITLDITGLYEQIVGDTEGARSVAARQHRQEVDRLREILSEVGAKKVDELRARS